jgi:hypothetical protein
LAANGEDIATALTEDQRVIYTLSFRVEPKAGRTAALGTSSIHSRSEPKLMISPNSWVREPFVGNTAVNLPQFRALNIHRALIPVDLSAVLYGTHIQLAGLLDRHFSSNSSSAYPARSTIQARASADWRRSGSMQCWTCVGTGTRLLSMILIWRAGRSLRSLQLWCFIHCGWGSGPRASSSECAR